MNNLFDGNESDDNEVTFKIENEYAKKYDCWREKEEYHKLEQKYGDKTLTSDLEETDSEDESDESTEISEQTEKQFLKTLALLKVKDPRIYDPKYEFFDEAKKTETKNEVKEDTKLKPQKQVNSLAAAFAESDEDSDSGQIFKVVQKAPEPQPKKETLKDYLIGNRDNVDEEELAPLKALWSDPKLNEGEAFLRDYILNKKYLDYDADCEDKELDAETLEADEARVEEQGHFERAYNFRFEEPDQEYLKRFPRTMNSIRPKDDRRTRKRAEIRERKEQEKAKKMEEIARLKAFKLKDIQEKISKIKEVTGNKELAFKEEDIDGDFDPEEHDRRMKAIFDQQYYQEADTEKPVFPELDEELEIENWEDYEREQLASEQSECHEAHCEDEDFNMDADYDANKVRTTLMEEIQETLGKKRRNRKRKSKLAQLLATKKPTYIPNVTKQTYAEFMDEYYKMDCEDVIGGDLPTRFKYRDVVPNSFGLTVEEILLADDKELNQWASLKKTVKYRPENVEKGEVKTYQQKAEDMQLKRKILPSLFKHIPEEPEIVENADIKRKIKEGTAKKQVASEEIASTSKQNEATIDDDDNAYDTPKKKQKIKKAKHDVDTETANTLLDTINNELIDVCNSDEIKRKKKKKKKTDIEKDGIEINEADTSASLINNELINGNEVTHESKHKKKKNKLVNTGADVSELEANTSLDSIISNELLNGNEPNTSEFKHKKFNRLVENNVIEVNTDMSHKKNKRKKDKSKNNTMDMDIGGINNIEPTRSPGNVSTAMGKSKKNNKRKLEDVGSTGAPAEKKKKLMTPAAQQRNKKHKKDKTKMKHKNKKFGKKSQMDTNENPLGKLSDGRLKAFGLNPKKYRSFLKYKRF